MRIKMIKFSTPLGEMIAAAHDDAVVLLEFSDSENLERDLNQIVEIFGEIEEGENLWLKKIRAEIEDYFKHPSIIFTTPIELIGTDFQKQVWQELLNVHCGLTTTYSEIAEKINNQNAARAVAGALNANKLAIIVPCHRVLTKDLEFGGYNAGANRKSWLLQHEGI